MIVRGLVALLALTAWAAGQEPVPQPPPEEAGNGAEGGAEQQEEKKDPEQNGEKQDPPPPPVPAGDQQPPVESPIPAPVPVETPVAESAAPAPATPVREPIRAPLDADGVAAALRALNAAHPELTHLELLGRSAQGREILALTLGAMTQTDGGGPAGRPTLLLVDHRGFESLGPEASIELVWRLAERATSDAVLRALLEATALVIAPALDPDARLTGAPGRPVRFDENFPSGWQPETIRPGAGKVSLSMPESLAAAGFLARLKHAALVIGFAPTAPALTPYPEAELPDDDRQVLARVVSALDMPGRPSAISWFDLGSHGGGLLDFAYQARGILPIVLPLPPEASSGAEGLAAWTNEVSERVVRCLALLPRIEILQEGLERLAPDTWQLDVRIQNAGLLPTQSALSLRREPGSDVALELEGAKLLATARRAHAAADYQDASFHSSGGRAALSGGTLAGGEARWLRLILESSTESAVRVTAATRWAGTASLAVTLP